MARSLGWMALISGIALAACGDGSGDIGSIATPQGRLWGARFAPDGDVLALAYGDENKIGTIDLDARTLRELTPGGTYLTGTAWSPAGDLIYFNGADGIGRITRDIGQTTMVNGAFATLGIDVSPDGTRLAYGVNGGNARVYTLAGGTERALDRPCQAIRFAPFGDRVACISGGELVLIELATEAVTVLVDHDVPFIAGLDWYKDGQSLLFTSTDGIERVTLTGERDLIHGAFAAIEVDLSADERSMVIGINGHDDLTLVRF